MKKIILFFIMFMLIFSSAYAYENYGDNINGSVFSGGKLEICADTSDNTNTFLKFSSSSSAYLFIPVEKISGGVIEISYKLKFINQGNNIIQLPMITSDKECLFIPQYHQNGLAINNGGKMNYFSTYNENTWYSFRYVIDTEMMKYDVYVNNRRLCRNYGFNTAVLSEIDGIKMKIATGSVYLDDITVFKTGESSSRKILFNSEYFADHINFTIGKLPYNMSKADFLTSLKLKSGVTTSFSTDNEYISDGDVVTFFDNIYNNSYNYTLKVRTLNISKNFFKTFKDSLILKEENGFYSDTVFYSFEGYKNGVVLKEALEIFGININGNLTLSQLKEKGLYIETYGDDCLIVRKTPFLGSAFMRKAWGYDIGKLFLK